MVFQKVRFYASSRDPERASLAYLLPGIPPEVSIMDTTYLAPKSPALSMICWPSSSRPTSPSSLFIQSNPQANLSELPYELQSMIFDNLLTKETGLTHTGLCALRNLSNTNAALSKSVSRYLSGEEETRFFQQQLEDAVWARDVRADPEAKITPSNAAIDLEPNYGAPGVQADVVTQVIVDKCLRCFKWIRQRVPAINCDGYNRDGWGFFTIAMYAQSIKIMTNLINSTHTAQTLAEVLVRPAKAFSYNPTPLGLLARRRNLRFTERMLEFVDFYVSRLDPPVDFGGAFTQTDLYSLCTFITPKLANLFLEMGIRIDGPSSSGSLNASSYHAAAGNGPRFLTWLHENSSLDKCATDSHGEIPIHYAVRADRPDCVRWLARNGGLQTDWYEGIQTPVELAAASTKENSEEILRCLIETLHGIYRLDPLMTGSLLRTLSEGLQDYINRNNELPGYVEYSSACQEQEHRAIRKVGVIMEYSTGFRVSVSLAEAQSPDSRYNRGLDRYELAKSIVASIGLKDLLHVLERIF